MNNSSRREFLSRTGLVVAGLSLGAFDALAVQGPERSATGLLFDESDKDRMRATVRHPRFAPFWKTVVEADLKADAKFLRSELKTNSHVYDMLRARKILERTSFAYALTGDGNQYAVAQLAMEKILEYPKWDYFFEGGELVIGLQRAPEATIAMALALDWMGDMLSPALRQEAEKQIAEKGAPPCYRTLWGMLHPDRVRGWTIDPNSDYRFRHTLNLSRWPIILNSTNLKVIPIAGLGVAGSLLAGKHPEAQKWTDLAIQSARAFAPMFGADGSYEEGVSYWGYTVLHLALLVEVLGRRQGIDLNSLINFTGTVRYGLNMSMPTNGKQGDCVNFGDASVVGDTSVAAWVARRFHDPIAQFVALEIGEVSSHYAVVWYDPKVQPQKPGPELHDVRFSNDLVISRTGYDVASTVVAMRSGMPGNHEHADRNSVILKARGERLLHDPFKASYSYTEPHWLLRQTEAHTAVLINGKGHQYHDGKEGTNASWAEARVTHYRANETSTIATSDATEAYRLVHPTAREVLRTMIFVKPDVLILFDSVRLDSPGLVQARFQIYNEDGKGSGRALGNRFTIERPGVSLHASVAGSSNPRVLVGTLDLPEELGVFPYIEVNHGPSSVHGLLTACQVSASDSPRPDLDIAQENGMWRVSGAQDGRRFAVKIGMDSSVQVEFS